MISVIICTHNPRVEYLLRTIEALRRQDLPPENWELILVDNASRTPVSELTSLAWHPRSRIVHEDRLGLTAARLRGIREATGNLIVFVDDDNVLAPGYLSTARTLERDWPSLGAWGGSILPEFERQPELWAEPFLHLLALRQVARPLWGNVPFQKDFTPWGAGMCIRRSVAEAYRRTVEKDSRRRDLDRTGDSLVSCGDMDLAYVAIDEGMGVGVFPALSLTHLIPVSRMTEDYFLRLTEANAFSLVWLRYLRGHVPTAPPKLSLRGRLLERILQRHLDSRIRKFRDAEQRGYLRATSQVLLQHRMQVQSAVPASS